MLFIHVFVEALLAINLHVSNLELFLKFVHCIWIFLQNLLVKVLYFVLEDARVDIASLADQIGTLLNDPWMCRISCLYNLLPS